MRHEAWRLLLAGPFLAAVVSCGQAAGDDAAALRSRREFARAISKLKPGMPGKDVVALLGKPDDVRTEDSDGIDTTGTKEIWRYGTDGHLTTATLGQVYIDENDRVQYVFGQGKPPRDGLFEEAELRQLLRALDAVPSYNAAYDYNPRAVIRAVNLLQPLGKGRALAAIQEYLRIAASYNDGGREGVFLVLRVLFDVPKRPGYMPQMFVGAPVPPEPGNNKRLPRFPIVIEGDIPFLVVMGYQLGGQAEPPESHVQYFRKHGTLRRSLLQPTNKPFAALDRVAAKGRWTFSNKAGSPEPKRGRNLLGNQVLRMLDSVYRVEPDEFGSLMPWEDKDAAPIIAAARKLDITWDAKCNRYTFADGKTLPRQPPKNYHRFVWSPEGAGHHAKVIIERYAPRFVNVVLEENHDKSSPQRAARVRVFDVQSQDESLAVLRGGLLGGGTRSQSQAIELPDGAQVRVEYSQGDKSLLSPVFRP